MKPKILISKCLGFENCRYNGAIVQFDLLDKMKDQIEFIPLCPEIEIGLGLRIMAWLHRRRLLKRALIVTT